MPLTPTSSGFAVTYSRSKCAILGAVAIPFAVLMIFVGLDAYFSFLDGTQLERLKLARQPLWAWAAVMIAGGAMLWAVALWNVKNAFQRGAAISVSRDGIEARTLIGRRSMRWGDIEEVKVFRGTVFLYPVAGAASKPTPLQTFLTSVSVNELTRALAQFRPALFSEAGDS